MDNSKLEEFEDFRPQERILYEGALEPGAVLKAGRVLLECARSYKNSAEQLKAENEKLLAIKTAAHNLAWNCVQNGKLMILLRPDLLQELKILIDQSLQPKEEVL